MTLVGQGSGRLERHFFHAKLKAAFAVLYYCYIQNFGGVHDRGR